MPRSSSTARALAVKPAVSPRTLRLRPRRVLPSALSPIVQPTRAPPLQPPAAPARLDPAHRVRRAPEHGGPRPSTLPGGRHRAGSQQQRVSSLPLLQPRLPCRTPLNLAPLCSLVRADTGSGKTLIAILALRQLAAAPLPANNRRDNRKRLVVFLTPTTTLVSQQAQVIEAQTSLRVKSFVGAQGVDYWKRDKWQQELDEADVVVLTPQIWLDILRNAYYDLRDVQLVIFDEAHHAQKSHPYALIMREHYHPLKARHEPVPRILGLTASPIWNVKKPQEAIRCVTSSCSCLHRRRRRVVPDGPTGPPAETSSRLSTCASSRSPRRTASTWLRPRLERPRCSSSTTRRRCRSWLCRPRVF